MDRTAYLERLSCPRSTRNTLKYLHDVDAIKAVVPEIVDALKLSSFEDDRRRACFSSFCPLYKEIKDLSGLSSEPYLSLGLPLAYIRFYACCRLAGNLFLNFHMNRVL